MEAFCEKAFEWEYPGENTAIMRISDKQVELSNLLRLDNWSQIPIYMQEQPNESIIEKEILQCGPTINVTGCATSGKYEVVLC